MNGPFKYSKKLKRIFDYISSLLLLTLLLPVILLITLAILISMGKPVLFKQKRPGLKGRPFNIVKYRTMRPPWDNEVAYLSDTDRLTSLGRYLRKKSLDELPVLWNVIRGEMSLVGPRPLVMEYLSKYSEEQKRRHDVIPGITGWAQVNGRQNLTFNSRLILDIWYVDHWSNFLDLKILLKTIKPVILGSGVISGQNISEVDDAGFFIGMNTKGDEE